MDMYMEVVRNGKNITLELKLQYIPPRKRTWDCAGEPEEFRVKAYDCSSFFKEVPLYPSEESQALAILLEQEFVMTLTRED